MSLRRVLVDSSVFLYALGGDHPLKRPCSAVIQDERLALCASVEMVQEVLFHRMRVSDRSLALEQAERVAASCQLLPFDRAVLERAMALIARFPVGGRDVVHAATALTFGIREIVTPDSDFDGIEGLHRLDPRSLPAD